MGTRGVHVCGGRHTGGVRWLTETCGAIVKHPSTGRAMETMLFTERSLWTMIHGIVLGGGALLALAAVLFSLHAMRAETDTAAVPENQARYVGWLMVLTSVLLWLTVLVGTYITFPPYRATPAEGITDLSRYPRALILSSPGTAWLHAFAMEVKEHMPWIAAMLATAVAYVSMRYRSGLLTDSQLGRMATTVLAICFVLVSFVAILGVFINKVAPLE